MIYLWHDGGKKLDVSLNTPDGIMIGTDKVDAFSSTDGEILGSSLVYAHGTELDIDEGTTLSSSIGSFDGSNEGTILGSYDGAYRQLEMALLMYQHWESHLNVPMVKRLGLMKAS